MAAPAEVLLAVLRENLSVQEFDMDSGFYAHGGDSLIAVRVVNDAQARGIPITLRDLMLHETARGILSSPAVAAALAGSHRAGPAEREDPAGPFCFLTAPDRARVPAGVVDALPAAAISMGVLYLCEVSRDPQLYHLMEGWEVRAAFDEACFRTALAELSSRHPALRTSFDLGGLSVPAQLVWEQADPALTVLRAGGPEDAAALLGEWRDRQLASLIDWSRAPLVRYCVAVTPQSFHVVSSAHHAVADGWSLSRLTVDLMTLYHGEVEGVPAELPAGPGLDVQRRFIAAERAAESSAAAAGFWFKHADAPALLSRGAKQAGVADTREHCGFELGSSLVESLAGVTRMLNAPMKSVFLAAHVRALGTWAGRTHDVVTGVVFSTRPAATGSDLAVGLFLNTLPVRFATVDTTWASLVRCAAETERECAPYLAYPHAKLAEQLGRPAFDVLFNFVSYHAYQELGRLTSVPVHGRWHLGKSSFPFHVSVEISGLDGQVRIGFDPAFVSRDAVDAYAGTVKGALYALAANPVSPASAPALTGDRRI